MMKRTSLLALAAACLAVTVSSPAHARAVEFIVGGGGGYEWFDLQALSYDNLLSVEAVDTSGNTIEYSPPVDKYKGSYFVFDVYAGIKILAFGLMVDYRGAYTKKNLHFNQLMFDLTFFIPTKRVVPFIRMGVGWVYAKARIRSTPEYEVQQSIMKSNGIGGRVGAGLDIKIVKFFSIGAGCDVGFLYFDSKSGTSFGMMVDALLRLTLHV